MDSVDENKKEDLNFTNKNEKYEKNVHEAILDAKRSWEKDIVVNVKTDQKDQGFLFKFLIIGLLSALLLSNTKAPLVFFMKYVAPKFTSILFISILMISFCIGPIYAIYKAKKKTFKYVWREYVEFLWKTMKWSYQEIFCAFIELLFSNVGALIKYFFLFLYLIMVITVSIVLAEQIKQGKPLLNDYFKNQ